MNIIKQHFHPSTLSLFLILCLIPFIDEYFLGLYNEKRFFQSALLILCALLYFRPLDLEKRAKLLLFITFSLGFISSILSNNLLNSGLNYLHSMMLICLVFLGYKIKDNNSILFYTILFSNIFILSFSLLNYFFLYFQVINHLQMLFCMASTTFDFLTSFRF